jgi:hypothetical protein
MRWSLAPPLSKSHAQAIFSPATSRKNNWYNCCWPAMLQVYALVKQLHHSQSSLVRAAVTPSVLGNLRGVLVSVIRTSCALSAGATPLLNNPDRWSTSSWSGITVSHQVLAVSHPLQLDGLQICALGLLAKPATAPWLPGQPDKVLRS